MRQILLLILLFFASTWVARKLRESRSAPPAARQGDPFHRAGPRGSAAALPEPMVRCAECGVHAPQGDAVVASGEYFCCADHAARHAAARAGSGDARDARDDR